MVLVRIQNPFKNEYVVVNMPQDMKLADMQQVSELACKMANDISGSSEIPKSFTTFPVTTVGKRALLLVAQTMPDELANAQEGQLLISMLSAVNFLDQLLDRVGKKVMMRKSEYKNSIIEYCTKSPPEFVDAVRARALHLVDQARRVVPADELRANRLATLVDIVFQTFSELQEQSNESSDAEEKQFGGSEEPLELELEEKPTEGELEEDSNEEEEEKPERLSDEESEPGVSKEEPTRDKKEEEVKEKNPAPQKKEASKEEEQVDEEEDEEMMSDEDEDPEFSDAEFVSDEDEMEEDDEDDS